MHRLSDLVTTLAEKVEVQVQARDSSDNDATERSGKRKRSASPSPPMQTESALNMRIEQLEHELSRLHSRAPQASAPLPISVVERTQELTTTRPAKRARTGMQTERRGGLGRSVAAAAGYTTLGAALAWTALAYAL